MKKIKFTDLYKLIPEKKKIFSKINSLVKNSKFIGGEEVENFEKNFSKYVKAKYCISLGNGTDAIEIALKSLNLKKNSEVIVPVNTWISTAEAVITNNLKLVFCDINLDDYSISVEDLKKKINKKTSAIIVVHLYGNPSNMRQILKIATKKKIKVVEDCAQAHGTKFKNKHVGTFGSLGTFSFFPGKNLGGFGDGGAIVTNSKSSYLICKRLRNHGALKKYDHKFSGRNSRLDTINAAILDIKLKSYSKVIKKRNELANEYFKSLKNTKKIQLFRLNKSNTHSFHQFVIRCSYRNELKKFLEKNQIQTLIHYPYMLNELKFFNNKNKFKNSYNLGKKILSLPISEEHSIDQIKHISKKINFFYNNRD